MTRQTVRYALLSLSSMIALANSGYVSAEFLADSKASLELRNMYMNRDFRQSSGPATQEDWGQGFTLRAQSGFTEGTVGFGVDAMAQLGVKLDSTPRNSGTGVLAVNTSGEPEDSWSELGLTAKARFANSTLRLGTLQPVLPVVMYNDTRLLSSAFNGGMLTSDKDIPGLTLNVGRLNQVNQRDSSSWDDLSFVYNGAQSDHFSFAGGAYDLLDNLSASYYYGKLDNIYDQHFLGLVNTLPLADKISLRTDLRYFRNSDSGEALGGKIDNDTIMGMLTLSVGAHKFGAAYQQMSGDGNFPFLAGGDPYSVNLVTYNTFGKADTDAWQLRYDYDFASLGIPGLSFMTRYVNGSDIDTPAVSNGKEWERDTDLAYVIQDGSLKGLNVRWRNVTFRSGNGLTNDLDENRLIIGYTLPLW